MDKKVYILVPVYNVEKYLKDCIESVIAQTYKNWEMILVDDGSTDSSGKICDSYAEKDSRIRVVHQENQGSSAARLTAVKSISEIENTYCMFCDSDDLLPSNVLELFINAVDAYNCDIVSGEMKKFLKSFSPDLTKNENNLLNPVIYEEDNII